MRQTGISIFYWSTFPSHLEYRLPPSSLLFIFLVALSKAFGSDRIWTPTADPHPTPLASQTHPVDAPRTKNRNHQPEPVWFRLAQVVVPISMSREIVALRLYVLEKRDTGPAKILEIWGVHEVLHRPSQIWFCALLLVSIHCISF